MNVFEIIVKKGETARQKHFLIMFKNNAFKLSMQRRLNKCVCIRVQRVKWYNHMKINSNIIISLNIGRGAYRSRPIRLEKVILLRSLRSTQITRGMFKSHVMLTSLRHVYFLCVVCLLICQLRFYFLTYCQTIHVYIRTLLF